MTAPNWLNPIPFGDVGHGPLPGNPQQWEVLSEDQLQQMRKQLLESVLSSVVQAVQGLFIPGPFGAALDQLEAWANGLPTFQMVLAEFTASTGLVLDQGPGDFLNSLFVNINNAVNIDLSSPLALVNSIIDLLENAVGGAVANIQDVLNTIGNVLGFPAPPGFDLGQLQAWVSQNVFGFINPDRLPMIPVSHIGDARINLLSNPQFSTDAIYDPTNAWTVDPNINHSGVEGSATTIAVGDLHELFSNDLITVTPGQQLDIYAWVKIKDVVASGGGAIQLGLKTFTTSDGSGVGTVVDLASLSTYGTADWRKLEKPYTVTGDVKSLRVRIAVTENVTAGQVWFDDMWCSKQGLMPIDLVQDLGEKLSDLLQRIEDGLKEAAENLAELLNWVIEKLKEFLHLDEWQTWLDKVWAALTGKPPKPEMEITDDDAADQLALQLLTLAAQNTNIALLQAQIAKPDGGMFGGDDFERPDSNVMDGWTVQEYLLTGWGNPVGGNGYFRVRNGQAMWRDEGPVGNRAKLIRSKPADALTKTPWQAITRVTGTTVAEGPKGFASAVDYIYGRVSANGRAYIVAWTDAYLDLLDGGWKWRLHLGYNLGSGGDKHFVDDKGVELSIAVPPPSGGCTYTLQCGSLDNNGDADDQYRFRVLRDNRVFIEHFDQARVSAPVKDNKGWGFGGAAQPWALTQLTPSSLHSITVMDTKAP